MNTIIKQRFYVVYLTKSIRNTYNDRHFHFLYLRCKTTLSRLEILKSTNDLLRTCRISEPDAYSTVCMENDRFILRFTVSHHSTNDFSLCRTYVNNVYTIVYNTLSTIVTFKEDTKRAIEYGDSDSDIDKAREIRTIEDPRRYENNFNK